MLELFQVNWSELTQKMPEIAEAGYTSLWLPNPAKGNSGTSSFGYDQFDPFDLGDKNQQGTTATKYGTKAQLLQMVETAHRFGIRVYFDNVMNHRSSVVPGFNSSTPTNYYPGLIPKDFHLYWCGGNYANWSSIGNFCNQQEVQNQPLLGLADLAQEPGTNNFYFGCSLGNTTAKPVFVRQPSNRDYYTDTNTAAIGGGWHGFNGTNGQPVPELVETYLTRAAMYTLYTTKCDGFRFDAVKHVPSNFFGNNNGSLSDDSSFAGYIGGIQAMYDWTHGYGSNVTGNGYMETDGNRNSLFNTEAARNDAMLFGEHVSPVPDYQQYLGVGMRLINQPLYNQLNSTFSGSAGLYGLDGRDYTPPDQFPCGSTAYHCYSTAQSVMFPQTQDGGTCCPVHEELQNAYYFMHEGLPMVYSDGFNHNTGGGTPIVSFANYLGEKGDNTIPDVCYLHNQLARGGTWSRWSDQNIVAFERYDYREGTNAAGQDVVLFALSDKGYPGDISFDDGVSRTSDGYYRVASNVGSGNTSVSNSRNVGLVVGFTPGSVLVQLASSATGADRAYKKLLVHGATQDPHAATNSATASDPTQRLIYVGGQTLAPGGGAIELTIPSGASDGSINLGGWVMYGYQWPEASRANVLTNAITFRQGGAAALAMTVYRHDGANGDTNFNPLYPFKMRGSVDPNGAVIGGVHVSNLTYAIDIPVLTNNPFDISIRCDASAANVLAKMDGGLDLNSQIGYAPTNGFDRRDNRPGYASDVYLGYEQTAQQFRNGPEKFAARNVSRDNVTSLGAETYYYIVGSTNTVVNGNGNGANIATLTPDWVYHDPANTNSAAGGLGTSTQRIPLSPTSGQSVDLWVKVGDHNHPNTNLCFIYYTTDGSNPEGAYGVGKGTTQVLPASWITNDTQDTTSDWFKTTIPASNQVNGVQVRYKAAFYEPNIGTISDPDNSKLYGLTQFGITNFDPTTVVAWLHNDLNTNNTAIGLKEGFHIVRARCFLPRSGKSSVYNTFLQSFYYDAGVPTGAIAYPPSDNFNITTLGYTVVVRADSSVTEVDYRITDSNGQTNGVAGSVNPDSTIGQQYPNYPQEYRFTYTNIPSSGTATITVTLKKLTSSALTNRVTTLTRTVNTLAPVSILSIVNPPTDNAILIEGTNDTLTLQTCFTSGLTGSDSNVFSIYINGVFQPRPPYIIRGSGCSTGLRALYYNLTGPAPGTNVVQVLYTNGATTLSDMRTIAVARPGDSDGDGMSDYQELIAGTDPFDPNSVLEITALANGNLLVWSSVSNRNYQVWGTTNLNVPMVPLSTILPSGGASTFFTDPMPDPVIKFYRIQVVP
jgi:hypothetical protein